MRAHTFLIGSLVIASAVLGGCGGGGLGEVAGDGAAAGDGLIMCSGLDAEGERIDGMQVITPEGETVRTIGTATLFPQWVPRGAAKIIVSDPFSPADESVGTLILDVAAGEAIATGEELDNRSRWYTSERFVVMNGPSEEGGFLVDLETGSVTDLTEAVGLEAGDEPRFAIASFDDAEEHLLLLSVVSGQGAWVVPTDEPSAATSLGSDIRGAALRSDGERVAWVTGDGDGFLSDIGGESVTTLGSDLFTLEFIGDDVIASADDTLLLFDGASGEQRILWEGDDAGFPSRIIVVGDRALTGFIGEGDNTWLVADRDGATEVTVAADFPEAEGNGWILFTGRSEGYDGLAFDLLSLVDLESAEVTELSTPDQGVQPGLVSPTGDHLILLGRTVLLLDARASTLVALPEFVRAAMFSPDGERMVMAIGDDREDTELVVAEVDDPQNGTSTGVRCDVPVWVSGAAEIPARGVDSAESVTPDEPSLDTPTTETPVADDAQAIEFEEPFDDRLASGWRWQDEVPADWSLQATPGWLQVRAVDRTQNLLLRDAPDGAFEVTIAVRFRPTSNFQFAGLLVGPPGDEVTFVQLGRQYCAPDVEPDLCIGDGIYFDSIAEGVPRQARSMAVDADAEVVYLRIVADGSSYEGFVSDDGASWSSVGRDDRWFDEAEVGLIAYQAVEEAAIAEFDYVLVTSPPAGGPPPPAESTVPPATGNDAADPGGVAIRLSPRDDPDRPLQLEVLRGDLRLTTGTTLQEGSSVWVDESWFDLTSGTIVEITDGEVDLDGRTYAPDTTWVVDSAGRLTDGG